MFSNKDRLRSWLVVISMLALLLGFGVAVYALQTQSGAAPLTGKAALQANAVSGAVAAPADTSSDAPVPPQKTLPNGVTIGYSVKNDLSPPLRDIPPAPRIQGQAPENEMPLFRLPTGPAGKDTVVQRFFSALAMPTPSLTFEGISSITSACGCLPPDTNGDVGPNHYVQSVNSAFQIWDKTGTSLYGPAQINTLWSGFGGPCQTLNSGDPITLYDSLADRWLMSQFTASAPYYECIAISQTGDPTGAWYRYAFPESNTIFGDYPKLGVWPDGYYMSTNGFAGTSYSGGGAFVFDRTRMLVGQPATFQYFEEGEFAYRVLPSDLDGSTPPPVGSPNYFATTYGSNATIRFWKFQVNWTNPISSTFTGPLNIPTAYFDPDLCGGSRNCIPQPGTTRGLDALAGGFMHRLAYRNFGDHESLVASVSVDENGQDHAGVRWFELRNPAGTPVVYQQGTYAPDADHRWLPSIAQDKDGNIAVGYSVSSATTFPSIRYAGRLTTDPLGTLGQGEATLIAGTGSQTSSFSRWGDYSAMVVDPSDDCTFWYTNEYYATTSNAGWQTRIGKFKFPQCGAPVTPSPTVTGTPPTATRTATPAPLITPCANYTYTVGTAIVVSGTQDMGVNCDDCVRPINLPFPVQFYGQTFNTAYASSNGNLQFSSSDYNCCVSTCLPYVNYQDAIFAYFDDLVTNSAGLGVFSSTSGIAPNRVFNLEWRAYPYGTTTPLNFEIRLYEGQNKVDIVYGTGAVAGTVPKVGLEHDTNYFTQYSCNNQPPLTAGLLVSFTLPCANVTPTPVASATSTVTATPTSCPVQFVDVPTSNTFYTYIRCLACRGIVGGYPCGGPGEPCPGNYYRPNSNVTRGQTAKIVSESAGFQDVIPSTQQTFEDVPPGSTFALWIERLSGRGIIGGYPCGGPFEPCVAPGNRPYFRPGNNVTRGQLSKITSGAAGWTETPTAQTFQDVPVGSTFYLYIERMASRGIISGYPCGGPFEPCVGPGNRPYFRPNNNATRGQMAKIAAQAFFPNCQTPAARR